MELIIGEIVESGPPVKEKREKKPPVDLTTLERVEAKGELGYVFPDGSIRRADASYLVKPPQARDFTSETAARAVNRRYELARQRAQKAIAEGAKVENSYVGWGEIIKARVRVALDDASKAGNEAAKFVGQAAGFLSDGKKQEETVHIQKHEYSIDAETRAFMEEIRKRQ